MRAVVVWRAPRLWAGPPPPKLEVVLPTDSRSQPSSGELPALPDNERRLVEAFLHGDGEAVRTIQDWVGAVIRHRAWRLQMSDDLEQDVLVELVRVLGAGRFEGRSSLKTFVQRVAKYTCLDAIRRETRREIVALEETAEPEATPGDDPEQKLDDRELARLCYAVLEALPEPCARLLRRILRDEPAYEELAAELDVAVGTVKSRVARCRQRAEALRSRFLRRGIPGGGS